MSGPWEDYTVNGPWSDYAPAKKIKQDVASLAAPEISVGDVAMGALKGASDIGSTLLRPIDALLNKTGATETTNLQRRQALKDFFSEKANPDSWSFKGGELGADIAGTAGVGGVLAKPIAGVLPKLATAVKTGGFSLGTPAATTFGGKAVDLATRAAGGAVAGGASAGLVNPQDAGLGAAIGGAMPVAAKAAGAAGSALAGKVTPEVVALYNKAKALGIDIPADRIANSKPMNAVASSLNYLPLSGRAATEEKMMSQLNRAVSRTFGQDSDNVTAALRKAGDALGKKFDDTLTANVVRVDNQFMDELVSKLEIAKNELSPEGARIIENQVNQILSKANAAGELEGQAAYNIKKALDRIGNRNANEAYYARELKKSLMGALDRSLGQQEAAAFKSVRQQYGNMLELENLAQNGADGGISVARLANLKNINNPELQDIADIAAQFVRTRESPHGAMQRVMVGAVAGPTAFATGSLPLLAGGVAAGRAANTALNSNAVKSLVLNQGSGKGFNSLAENPLIRNALYLSPASP